MISPPEMNLLCEVFVMECIERFIISSVCKRRNHFCILQSLILFSSEGLQNFLPCLKKSTSKLMELHLFYTFWKESENTTNIKSFTSESFFSHGLFSRSGREACWQACTREHINTISKIIVQIMKPPYLWDPNTSGSHQCCGFEQILFGYGSYFSHSFGSLSRSGSWFGFYMIFFLYF